MPSLNHDTPQITKPFQTGSEYFDDLAQIFNNEFYNTPDTTSKTVAADAAAAETIPAKAQEQPLPPRGRPGRPAEFDWDRAEHKIESLANSPGGLPDTQAAIVEHLAQWFINEFDDQPSESSLKKFVRRHLPPDFYERGKGKK